MSVQHARRATMPRATFLSGVCATVAASTATIAGAGSALLRRGRRPATIALVGGAWWEGSDWSRVVALLERAGHVVRVLPGRYTGLPSDARRLRAALAKLRGPVLVAGHAYGGAVMTSAAGTMPAVMGLVYVAAYAPDAGESPALLDARFVPVRGTSYLGPSADGLVYVDRVARATSSAHDRRAARTIAHPASDAMYRAPLQRPAWKDRPSWYQISEDDLMLSPEAQRFMAARAGATTISLKAGHASLVSHARNVADLIATAARS